MAAKAASAATAVGSHDGGILGPTSQGSHQVVTDESGGCHRVITDDSGGYYRHN